ncbi:MAG: hypothetical protein R3C26_12425 [Calditrichia bacterium]
MDLKKWNPISGGKPVLHAPKINIMKLAHKSSAVMATHLGYLLKPDLMQQTFADLEGVCCGKQYPSGCRENFSAGKMLAMPINGSTAETVSVR